MDKIIDSNTDLQDRAANPAPLIGKAAASSPPRRPSEVFGSPIPAAEYIVLAPSTSHRMAFGVCREAWGSWSKEDSARTWMQMRYGAQARNRVHAQTMLLQSPKPWERELKLLFPGQSGAEDRKRSHVVLLAAAGHTGERSTIGPVFFPEENDSPEGPRKGIFRELGMRYAEIVPLFDREQHPQREFKIDTEDAQDR